MRQSETTDTLVVQSALRESMRRVASPVTVVTAGTGDSARGITIGSFTSASLDPPLITFNLSRGARIHSLLPRVDRFVVHVLGDEQSDLSDHFALPDLTGTEQFDPVNCEIGEDGIPVLIDCQAVFFCSVYNVFPVGDHSLIVGLVDRVASRVDGNPLVYFDRAYRSITKTIARIDGRK